MATKLAYEAATGQLDLSEQQQLELFEAATEGLTPQRVNAVMQRQFTGDGPIVFLTTDAPPADGNAGVEALLDKAAREIVRREAPPAEAPKTE